MKTSDLVEYASDPAFAVDGNMKVIGWNAGAEELLGYSSEEAVGQGCGQMLQALYSTGEPLCSALCEGLSCFVSGKKWTIERCQIRHRDGRMIDAGISTLVIPLEARERTPGEAVAVVFMHKPEPANRQTKGSQRLRVFTLGRFNLAVSGRGLDVDNWQRKQAVVVLKCLVGQLGRPVHRERLIEWLWPEADAKRGWHRLKVTISFLRAKLKEAGLPDNAIETIGQSYVLRKDAVWVDSVAFVSLVAAGRKLLNDGNWPDARGRFEDARSLYCGDYLEDEPYADWCAEARGSLREIYLEMLDGMTKCYAADGLFLEAAQVCRTALSSDPCRESFLCALVENLVNLGRPDWAKVEFLAWRRRIDEEYGLKPMDETLRIYAKLINDRTAKTGISVSPCRHHANVEPPLITPVFPDPY